MEQKLLFNYINAELQIGVCDIRNIYLLTPTLTKLLPEVYKGKLVYRIKGTSKRISYISIKRGLVKKKFFVNDNCPF